MNGKDIELSRRRVLGGIATVGVASAAAGAGTFAFFNDTETSSSNTVEAGTLDLTGSTDGQIDVSGIVPGESVPTNGTTIIQATYDSGSSVDPAEVDFSAALSEPAESTEPSESTDQTALDFASKLNVSVANLVVNGSQVKDLTSTHSVTTVADLAGISIDAAFGGVSPSNTLGLELAFTFDSTTGNAYQADGVSIQTMLTAQQPTED